jgi:hypothetical protein
MDTSEAQSIVALVQAFFPVPKLPESTVNVWARELEPLPFAIASEAVRLVGRNGTPGPVNLSDILNTAVSLMKAQAYSNLMDRNELHALTEGIDEDSQAIIDAYFDNIGGRPA